MDKNTSMFSRKLIILQIFYYEISSNYTNLYHALNPNLTTEILPEHSE